MCGEKTTADEETKKCQNLAKTNLLKKKTFEFIINYCIVIK
jgi:hypothetical protein